MSRYLPARLTRLAGPTPLVRRLSAQSVLFAIHPSARAAERHLAKEAAAVPA